MDCYGPVRECRDFSPLAVAPFKNSMLPLPYREFSFSMRAGWRYHPRAPSDDRLGRGRNLTGKLSKGLSAMAPPQVLNHSDNNHVDPNTRKTASQTVPFVSNDLDKQKRQKVEASAATNYLQQGVAPVDNTATCPSSSATVITESTKGSSTVSSSSSSLGTARMVSTTTNNNTKMDASSCRPTNRKKKRRRSDHKPPIDSIPAITRPFQGTPSFV